MTNTTVTRASVWEFTKHIYSYFTLIMQYPSEIDMPEVIFLIS